MNIKCPFCNHKIHPSRREERIRYECKVDSEITHSTNIIFDKVNNAIRIVFYDFIIYQKGNSEINIFASTAHEPFTSFDKETIHSFIAPKGFTFQALKAFQKKLETLKRFQ